MRTVDIPGIGMVDVEDDITDEEIVASMNTAPNEAARPELMSRPAAAARFGAQGAALGFGEEIEAGVRTGFGLVGDYEATRDTIRSALKQYQAERPGEAMAYELAGAVAVPGLAAAKLGKVPKYGKLLKTAITGGNKLKTATAVSAAQGALGTAGRAETMQDFREQLPVALAMSAAAPAGSQAVMGVGRNVAGTARKVLGGSPEAEIIRNVKRGAGTVQQMQNLSASKPHSVLAELGGENLARQAEMVAQRPGRSSDVATKILGDRALQSGARVAKALGIVTGGDERSAYTWAQRLASDKKSQAAPLYELARKKPIPISPTMRKVMNTQSGQKAMAIAYNNAQDDIHRNIPSGAGIIRREDGFYLLPAKMDFDTAQDIKQAFSALHTSALMSDDALSRGQIPALGNLSKMFRSEVFDQNKAWKMADTAWSGMSRVEDSLALGKNINKIGVDELKDKWSMMTPFEKDMFRVGMVDHYRDIALSTGRGRMPSIKLLGSDMDRMKLAVVTDGDDKILGRVTRAIDDERAMMAFKNKVLGGSQTAQRLAAADDADLLSDNWKTSAVKMMRSTLNNNKKGEQFRDELGEALFSTGPERDANLRKLLEAERKYDIGTARATSRGVAAGRAASSQSD